VGGDGTFSEVVAGMVAGKHSVPIGYIPAGSTNDYIEVINNAQSMTEVNAKSILWWEELTLKGENLAACAGMDLHRLTDMSMKFATYAEGNEDGDVVTELHAAIEQKKTWVSKGMLVTWTIDGENIIFRLHDVHKPGFVPSDRYTLTLKNKSGTREFDITPGSLIIPLAELEDVEIPKLYGENTAIENLICIAPVVRKNSASH